MQPHFRHFVTALIRYTGRGIISVARPIHPFLRRSFIPGGSEAYWHVSQTFPHMIYSDLILH
jgi:hypothetical protein